MIRKLFIKKYLLFILLCFVSILQSEEINISNKIVNTPNGFFYRHLDYTLDFLMYKNGGILTDFNVGLLDFINLGLSFDMYKVIGDEKAHFRCPKISGKFKVYNGDIVLPKFYLGYSGETYGAKLSDRDYANYEQKEKGVFVALEREMFVPNLFIDFGANIYDFIDKKIYGFVNARYFFFEKILLLLEYDNIRHTPENELNIGIKYFLEKNFSIGIAFKNIKRRSRTDGYIDRFLFITYSSSF